MGKPESLRNNFLMKGSTNTSASQRTQVRWIDGSYLMIYAYKTQDIASCKTLCMAFVCAVVLIFYVPVNNFQSCQTFSCLPGLNQYYADYKVSCSGTQNSTTCEYPTSDPSTLSLTLPRSHCASLTHRQCNWMVGGCISKVSVHIMAVGLKYGFIYEPWHEISNNVVCATSNCSDQPAHTRSLIRAFASRLNIIWLLSYWPNIFWSF